MTILRIYVYMERNKLLDPVRARIRVNIEVRSREVKLMLPCA